MRPLEDPRCLASPVTSASSSRRSDRKSTRLNSSHLGISYAVFCLKKKNKMNTRVVQWAQTARTPQQAGRPHAHPGPEEGDGTDGQSRRKDTQHIAAADHGLSQCTG